jgi:predicted metal-dependent phosphoesterase TrpH
MTTSKLKKLIKVEFHCHTVYSGDSSNRLDALIRAARERGIERLAITDHNTIEGALKAKALAPKLVIVGEEVLTERGELIAYYVREEVPKGLTVGETLRRLKAQGAFISIPHPFDLRRHGWPLEELIELLPEVDALEVFNARCLRKAHNDKALAFARKWGIPMLAGSDAHSLVELGLAVTRLPAFNSVEELRAAVRETQISGRMLSVTDHFKASALIGLSKIIPGAGVKNLE